MMGATGPVAQGTNFDWDRQDTKPGLLNLNLIIDEEVFFSVVGQQDANFNQQWLNFIQVPPISPGTYSLPLNGQAPIPQYGPPVPLVVTAIDAQRFAGLCLSDHQPGRHGHGSDPRRARAGHPTSPSRTVDSRIKAAFAQFLWLRHGGSGYLFGFGNGAVGQNSAVVPIDPPIPAPAGYGSGIPAERPFRSLSFPDIDYTVMRPATLPPSPFTNPAEHGRRPRTRPIPACGIPIYTPATRRRTPRPAAWPPRVPRRRTPARFPSADCSRSPMPNPESNASEPGDPFINNQEPTPPATIVANAPPPAPGAAAAGHAWRSTGRRRLRVQQWISEPDLVRSGRATTSPVPPEPPSTERRARPAERPHSTLLDAREHPFWRIEMLQRVMNLTTVRTHQYAVWITVGFFEVKRRGNVAMIASADPRLAFDVLGPEIGLNGEQAPPLPRLLPGRPTQAQWLRPDEPQAPGIRPSSTARTSSDRLASMRRPLHRRRGLTEMVTSW